MQTGDDLIDLGDFSANGIVGGTTGKNAQQQNLGFGKALLQSKHNGTDAFGNLGCRVRARLVRADHQHHRARLYARAFAVLESIKHALGGVASIPKFAAFQP